MVTATARKAIVAAAAAKERQYPPAASANGIINPNCGL
jgi:hypothetical protein